MPRQPRYKLEQPRYYSNNPFNGNHLTTTPKIHYISRNNHDQLNANSTFRPVTIDLKAARERRQSYKIAQQQPSIIPHINQPRINENHYLAPFNENVTNEMERKEKKRRLENKRQHQSSKRYRSHRSSKSSRSDRSSQTSSGDVGCCCCTTDFGSNTSNSDDDGSYVIDLSPNTSNLHEDGCGECGNCCSTDTCDCSGCECDF
ncbi:unnamed protein product [Adineta steineri]|uniref:Uncharacterized protein n=1 Tax=Adineta steineri TaxID=433720 RepID=A0A819R6I9_9BILA|nr:unnamed protein product [Adineta steineri]CAF4040897.1 unnamed protein product [Adineta steineri]